MSLDQQALALAMETASAAASLQVGVAARSSGAAG
jgi:hypothetical protein